MSSSQYPVVDDELMDHIAGLPEAEARDYLFLAPHKKFSGRWYVDCLNSSFFLDFEEIIGKYRTVSPASLQGFLDHAESLKYKVVFEEDPLSILTAWEHLNDEPDFSLNSSMEGTVNGMLPFQLQGFNYLRRAPKGGLAIWSTGTGKTALETALLKQHLEQEDYQVGLVVCKRNNKVDTQRKLLTLGSIDYAYIFDGTPKKRAEIYEAFLQALAEGEKLIGITNYEKFRDDPEFFEELFDGRRIVVFWDEMPTKLSNRGTILYDSVRSALYDGGAAVHWKDKRPEALRQYDLTATPIENSPVGVLNQVRLIDPDVWPTVKDWERTYVSGRNFFSREPEDFKDLDRMGLEIEFMTHQVDKRDPDIAKLFPKVHEQTIIVDWSPEDRRIYEQLQKIAIDLAKEAKKDPEVKTLNPLALIGVLQMLCDAPSMVQKSGENRDEFEAALAEIEDEEEAFEYQKFLSGSEAASILLDKLKKPLTNENCNKLKELRELITVTEAGRKGIVFTKFSTYLLPILEEEFEKWGVTFVTFRGNDRQRQEAVDQFRNDESIQIFLSSDAGSDSIDLPQAHWTLDYDLPPTYARKIQRRNRAHRINSWHEYVTHYGLQMPNSVEDRLEEILERKKGYHEGVFGGVINESAQSARMTAEDMWFVLTGDRKSVV